MIKNKHFFYFLLTILCFSFGCHVPQEKEYVYNVNIENIHYDIRHFNGFSGNDFLLVLQGFDNYIVQYSRTHILQNSELIYSQTKPLEIYFNELFKSYHKSCVANIELINIKKSRYMSNFRHNVIFGCRDGDIGFLFKFVGISRIFLIEEVYK